MDTEKTRSAYKSTLPLTNTNSKRIIRSLKGKADARRTLSERIADWMTKTFGSVHFLVINVCWFVVWIGVNIGLLPGITPFDPFPFGLLTMIVSLEAIVLAVFVLISQNRAAQIDDLREEIALQIDIITEQELTKLMDMVAAISKKQGIDVDSDEVLQSMLQPTNLEKIEKSLERQVLDR